MPLSLPIQVYFIPPFFPYLSQTGSGRFPFAIHVSISLDEK
jgi:hypothetical protein